MKYKYTLFLTFFFHFCFGQLDTEHWFAPMFDRSQTGRNYQSLYFSTNETVPFEVKIYNNNVEIGNVMVSKGNPIKFPIINREQIITTNMDELFIANSMGLYCKAEKKFFANLRFSTTSHAEIITSKGKAGIGKKFHVVHAPILPTNRILNFMASILATEDNTTVTVSNFDPAIVFSKIGIPSQINLTLKKGESYIIEGVGSELGNKTGFIGAKIISDKPISVTKGNFNGQYATNLMSEGSDILMDQSVPVERLGNEFAIIKGNGNIGLGMEGAIIVATEDNTDVFLNNSTTPVTTLQTGQFYMVYDSNFILNGADHYNMYIKSSKNIYVYQLLAGAAGFSPQATGGFNYIPPLNCFLPKKIDEIGLIDENEGNTANTNGSYTLTKSTKLNVISEKGAQITVNGVAPNFNNGPFNVSGTSGWVTYSFPNITGNVTINSSKSITAGISAGDGNVGYGGFFAGFSSIPVISKKTGECNPGLVLEVDPNYDTYQWMHNEVVIPGATSSEYTPTKSGYYSVKVTNGTCIEVVTPTYKVNNCVKNTTISEKVCNQKVYTPAFTNSTQSIQLSSISIVSLPTKETVSISPNDGKITYILNSGAAGTDSFQYKFCGTDPDFPDCELVTVNLNIEVLTLKEDTLKTCKISNQGVFNLSQANINAQGYPTKYYPSLGDAQNETNEIVNFTTYTSTGGNVYAKVFSPLGCRAISAIQLDFFELPILNVSQFDAKLCDDNLDGKIEVDFSKITPVILSNYSSFIVKYYQNQADAITGNTNALPNIWSYTANQRIFVRVESKDSCVPVMGQIDFVFGNPLMLTNSTILQEVCDDDFDAIKTVKIDDFGKLFTTDPLVKISYFTQYQDAQQNLNPLQNFNINISNRQKFYLRFEKVGECPNISSLEIKIKTPQKSNILIDKKICPNSNTILDAGSGFISYLWSTGATASSITVSVGNYWVDLTSANGCKYRQSVKVEEIILPKIDNIEINGSTVTFHVSGATPPYRYSLDGGAYQDSPTFSQLSRGKHTVSLLSADNCEAVTKEFSIINIINVITPNDDGYNDRLNYSDLSLKTKVLFKVFDRFGKLVFEGNSQNQFTWDGKYMGRTLPTDSYWYILEWTEPDSKVPVQFKSWILLKNRD